MAVPPWLPVGFAALSIGIAAYCTGRLVASRLWARATEFDSDALHAVMGVAMAGMLQPRLSPLPRNVWVVVFTAAAAWFAWQAIRGGRGRAGRALCCHPMPHLVECAAMIYMLLPASTPAGRTAAAAMPGMAGSPATGLPVLAVILALFMLGYILWTTDQLTSLSRAQTSVTARRPAPASHVLAAQTPGIDRRQGIAGAAGTGYQIPVGTTMLAPRAAACYKIAMSLAMGCMLIQML